MPTSSYPSETPSIDSTVPNTELMWLITTSCILHLNLPSIRGAVGTGNLKSLLLVIPLLNTPVLSLTVLLVAKLHVHMGTNDSMD